jgi:hypothetical protein
MTTPKHPEAVVRLAALIRELANSDEYRHIAHYSSLIADLQNLHDAMNAEVAGSSAHYSAHAAATKAYHAARSYALKWRLESPSSVMVRSGYAYSNPKVSR